LICLSFIIQISSAVTMSVTRLSTASVLLMTMLMMLIQRQTHGLGKMISVCAYSDKLLDARNTLIGALHFIALTQKLLYTRVIQESLDCQHYCSISYNFEIDFICYRVF